MGMVMFKCNACKHTVTEEHDDEIAEALATRDFPDHVGKGKLVMVCTSCYNLIKEYTDQKGETIQ